MKLTVYFEKDRSRKNIETKSKTIRGLLDELHINPVTVVVAVNKEIAYEASPLKAQDTVEIFEVVSGG